MSRYMTIRVNLTKTVKENKRLDNSSTEIYIYIEYRVIPVYIRGITIVFHFFKIYYYFQIRMCVLH